MESWKEDLVEILRVSIENASSIARRYYTSKPMSLDELLAHFRKVRTASIASVNPAGSPHIVPVSFVQHKEKIYVNTSERSVRYRNLLHQNKVSMTFLHSTKTVILNGTTKIAGRTGDFSGGDVDRAFIAKYGKARRVTPYSVMVEISPTKIFTYNGANKK